MSLAQRRRVQRILKNGPPHVVIASDRDDTLDGLQAYLGGAGFAVRGVRTLDRSMVERGAVSAVVIFADDFCADDVVALLTGEGRAKPAWIPVIVSGAPRRFDDLVQASDTAGGPIVLPKPAWGSAILDALRSRLRPSHAR